MAGKRHLPARPPASSTCDAYPEPQGFSATGRSPRGASFDATLGIFVLPYDAVATAHKSDALLLDFLFDNLLLRRPRRRLGSQRRRYAGICVPRQ